MPVALVTGGTRGIGAGVGRALVAAGYEVVAAAVGAEVDDFVAGEGIRAVRMDVTDADEVARVVGALPRLDALVNCAGILQRGGVEFTVEGFRRTVEVNLVGTMSVCLAAKEKLAAARGAIVNTASMMSFFGSPSVPGYSASKGGVAQLTKSLAAAWAADGIRVNAVAPGWIATDMTRPINDDVPRAAGILARTPAGRWGAPDDVASVVRFLLSEEARFVTGVVLPVDGGYLVT